ncbi:hypothetical protein [Streptomyces griseoflavus]|uniref:hypothetical protein n=1 Tax=Streptomyces griseoflavus TaxID=35619 RepID=UPI001FCC6DA6|nr:hypothetical protein [Streptomyces griseoflavus]
MAGEADEVRDDLQGEGAGEGVDGLEGAPLDEFGDEGVRLRLDPALETAQRTRGQVLGEGCPQLGVRRRVGGERGPGEGLVGRRIEGDRGRRERLPVGERAPDDVVPGQCVDVVLPEMDYGALLPQLGVGLKGVQQDVVGEEVDVGGGRLGHALSEVAGPASSK